MNYTDLQKHIREASENIIDKRLYNAFSIIGKLMAYCNNSDYQNKFESHYSTYRNMLKYSFEYNDDPEKEKVYNHLIVSMFSLSDEVNNDIIYKHKLKKYCQLKDQINIYYNITEDDSSSLVDAISFEREIENILKNGFGHLENEPLSIEDSRKKTENLFKFLWLTNKYQNSEIVLINKMMEAKGLPWYTKALMVSSITLSLLRYFDENKFVLLFNIAKNGEEQVWQRAFVGLIFCLTFYDRRIEYYPEIMNRVKILKGDGEFLKNLEIFFIQYTWQKESEKIAKRINEELMPDMIKMKSIIEEKLDLDNIVSADELAHKNPDWEDYFKDSPDIYKKFEEIQNLQTEGADIFMGAFSMLKQFPFFWEISNWFVPFYAGNKNIKEFSKEIKDVGTFNNIVEKLESTFFLCNSDKYSFCHNLKHVMQMQNKGMMDMFKSELEAMGEMAKEDQEIDGNLKNKYIFTQYLQDVYRFFKLYKDRNDFDDIFSFQTDPFKKWSIQELIKDTGIIHKIGEFYFNRDYYDKALEIYNELLKKEQKTELIEKIAFCHQQLGNLDSAIEFYERSLLMEKNKKWTLKQLAFCYRKKRNYIKALKYYKELEKENPDDLNLQADIGSVYLGLEDFENAINYYYKVEYLAPENRRVWRPLAWCSFVNGKMDTAKKYFEKLMVSGNDKNDIMNFGHVLWCQGEKLRAINCYKQAVKLAAKDLKWFDRVMREDAKYLNKFGIEVMDVHLMIDYVKMNIE